MDGHKNQPIEKTQSIPYFVSLETYLGGKVKTTEPTIDTISHLLFVPNYGQNQLNIKVVTTKLSSTYTKLLNITKNIL
jgi:hypothetical protein